MESDTNVISNMMKDPNLYGEGIEEVDQEETEEEKEIRYIKSIHADYAFTPSKYPYPSVLTSGVHNEADALFKILMDKEKQLISMLDCWCIVRGIGMNPTSADMQRIFDHMAPTLEKISPQVPPPQREEEKKSGAAKKKAIDGDAAVMSPGPSKKDTNPAPGDRNGEHAAADDAAAAPPPRSATQALEDVKRIDWTTFIRALEEHYKDPRVEEEELLNALRTLDVEGKGFLSLVQVDRAMKQDGEDVLAPSEWKQMAAMFPRNEIPYYEFIKKLTGSWTNEDEAAAIASLAEPTVPADGTEEGGSSPTVSKVGLSAEAGGSEPTTVAA